MSVITEEIGRVSIVPKGVWNGQNTYTRLDLVSYNGSSYIAKQDVPANTNLNNSDYWKLVAEKGDIGVSISGIRKTGTNILTDTYTIDFTDDTNTTFEVENGNGILNITKTGTSGIVDTYTITFTNGTSTTFNVTNGSDIASITKTETSADGLIDTYTVTLTNEETHTFVVRNGNGITSVTKTGTTANRLTDTYTITFEDGTSTTFNVNHGVGILSVTGPVSNGLMDTYTINFTDGTNTTFNIQNARSISSITEVDVTGAAGHIDKYRINFNDGSTPFPFEIYNGQNGEGAVSTVDEVQANSEGNVPLLILGNSAPTTSTVGQLKQRYYDRTNEILYICTGIDTSSAQAVYTWQGTGVPVDNELKNNSENPVQNKVLTAIIGTSDLTTNKDNLVEAINEIDSTVKTHSTGKLNTDVVVASWDPAAKQYYEGDYILKGAKLYRCIESHLSTTSVFDSSKWQQITVTDEIATKAPVGLGITNASVGKVPVIKTVDANGVPTSYEFGDKGTPIDSALSTTSENPVQNKVIKDALDHKATSDYFALQDTQPTNPETMLWINEHSNDNDEIEVYTVDETYNKDEVDEMVLPTGGTDGNVLVKSGTTDYAARWEKPQYSRPNLLDNWYFVGGGSQSGDGVFPINQRGQTTYVTQGPCIDRWRMRGSDNGSVAIASDGDGVAITLNTNTGSGNSYKSLDQILDKEKLQGKTVTFSCLVTGYVNDGAEFLTLGIWSTDNIVSHTNAIGTAEITAPGLVSITVDIPAQVSNTYLKAAVLIKNSAQYTGSVSIKIQAFKLELGNYQTLAHNEGTNESPNWVLNELPDYGQELVKCRRKYVKITKIPLSGFTNNVGKYCYVDTGFEMDGTVALTVSALGTLITTTGSKTLSDVIVWTSMSPHICLRFLIETPDSTVGYRPACVVDPVIELSTE